MTEDACFRPAGPDIVHDAIDDGIVVLNLTNGSYFTLDGVAREVWVAFCAGRSRDEVVAALGHRYDAGREKIARGVDAFLSRLLEEGLLVPAGVAVAAPAPAVGEAGGALPFSPPVLVKYTDMEDLLNLDPIHEVDDSGWPIARPTEEC